MNPHTRSAAERLAAMGGIAARIEHGVSLVDAAAAEDVPANTARSWLYRGRRQDAVEPFAGFAAAVDAARAGAATRPEPIDADELRLVVSEAARAGSVQAMRLYWEILRADSARAHTDPLAPLDELAARRAKGAGSR